jgi:uncharacterized protein
MITIAWMGLEEWLAEVATVELEPDGVRAAGTQLGELYRAHYELDARGDWITRRLRVDVPGTGTLELAHDGDGAWTVDGAARPDLDGALDCDLAFSPLTNLMPIRRHALYERAGAADFAMAWVSLPDLAVTRSEQRYEHVRPGLVRFSSGDFTADLELDADGLVKTYPALARRVSASDTSHSRRRADAS